MPVAPDLQTCSNSIADPDVYALKMAEKTTPCDSRTPCPHARGGSNHGLEMRIRTRIQMRGQQWCGRRTAAALVIRRGRGMLRWQGRDNGQHGVGSMLGRVDRARADLCGVRKLVRHVAAEEGVVAVGHGLGGGPQRRAADSVPGAVGREPAFRREAREMRCRA